MKVQSKKNIYNNSEQITCKSKILIIIVCILLLVNNIINILIRHLIKYGGISFNQISILWNFFYCF